MTLPVVRSNTAATVVSTAPPPLDGSVAGVAEATRWASALSVGSASTTKSGSSVVVPAWRSRDVEPVGHLRSAAVQVRRDRGDEHVAAFRGDVLHLAVAVAGRTPGRRADERRAARGDGPGLLRVDPSVTSNAMVVPLSLITASSQLTSPHGAPPVVKPIWRHSVAPASSTKTPEFWAASNDSTTMVRPSEFVNVPSGGHSGTHWASNTTGMAADASCRAERSPCPDLPQLVDGTWSPTRFGASPAPRPRCPPRPPRSCPRGKLAL